MKDLLRKLVSGIRSPKKIYSYFNDKLILRKEAKKILAQQVDFDRTIAVYVYRDIHLNFIKDTIIFLKNEGYSFHFFSGNPKIIGQNFMLNNLGEVRDYGMIKYMPYKILLTPATRRGLIQIHNKTKIVHMPHSIVSIHDIYSDKLFNIFDIVLCVGPHHVRELRSLLRNGNKEHLIAETGYEVVDRLMVKSKKDEFDKNTILFAPSWHEQNLLRTHGEKIISLLLKKYNVILRPHPNSLELDVELIDEIHGKYTKTGRFSIDGNVDASVSYKKAAVMISDYSGAAFEFALGFKRPVVFLDAPRKINNPNWNKYMDEEGIQVTKRSEIGFVSDFDSLSDDIDSVLDNLKEWETKIEKFTPEILFNPGNCAKTAAGQIKSVMDGKLNVFERID